MVHLLMQPDIDIILFFDQPETGQYLPVQMGLDIGQFAASLNTPGPFQDLDLVVVIHLVQSIK